MYLIFWKRGIWRGRWRTEEYQEGDGVLGGVTIVKGTEQDESRKHGMGEDRDGERDVGG